MRQLIQAANFNRFQQAGLSATQFMALNVIPADRTVAMGELAPPLNLAPATVAKMVDSLEARQMVRRSRHPEGGRVTVVTITRAGAKMQNAAAGQFRNHIAGLFEAMSPQERESI